MSSSKDRHYWSQLRAALTAGQWLAPFPAKTPHGAQLSWTELFRKFNKHCKGFHDVAEVASQTYGLALLLATSSLNEDEDHANIRDLNVELGKECILPEERVEEAKAGYEVLKGLQSSNLDSVCLALAYYAYALGQPSECLAYLAKVPDYSQIQSIVPASGSTRSNTSNLLSLPASAAPSSTSSLTGGFSSYSDVAFSEVKDGRGWVLAETFRSLCLQGMAHERLYPANPEKALTAYRSAIPVFRSLHSSEFASITCAPAKLSTGKLDFTPFVQLRELWRWVERLLWRTVCLSSRTSNVHATEGNGEDKDSLWMWLEKYTICSASWPPNFRAEHRSTISSIYLRALVLRHGIPRTPTFERVLAPVNSPLWLHTARSVVQDYRAILNVSTKFPRAGERNVKVEDFVDMCVAVWEASGGVGEYAGWVLDVLWWATRLTFNSSRVLRHMTRLLYLSGDVNLAKRSLRLYIQVVSKAWQASKQGAGDSVEDTETDSTPHPTHHGYWEDTDSDEHWVETLVFGARMLCKDGASKLGLEDVEDVREAKGVLRRAKERLREPDDEDEDDDGANTAHRRLWAEVELAEGICDDVLGIKEQDPYSRPNLLAAAQSHLLRSISLYHTPAAHFQLALSYARSGPDQNLEQAIQHAGLAAEGSAKDVRYWHLLGLLLTAVEKWDEANVLLDHGADLDLFSGSKSEAEKIVEEVGVADEYEKHTEQEGENGNTTPVGNGDDATLMPAVKILAEPISADVQIKDFALNIKVNENTNGNRSTPSISVSAPSIHSSRLPSFYGATPKPQSTISIDHVGVIPTTVLCSDATSVPPSSDLLRPILEVQSPPSRQELFEWGLQLRLTQMALTEVREGPEGAEEGWLEVFSWVAEKKGITPSSASGSAEAPPRQSFDGTRHTMDMEPLRMRFGSQISVTALNATTVQASEEYTSISRSRTDIMEVETSNSLNGDFPPPPIPITISIASSDVDIVANGSEGGSSTAEKEKRGGSPTTEKKGGLNGLVRRRRSSSVERGSEKDKEKGGDTSKSKRVQQMLKNRVHKGQMRITAVSKRIGHGVSKNGSLRRSNSTPDFHAVLRQTSYQASSIHSRRRLSSINASQDRTPTDSPTPPPPPAPLTPGGTSLMGPPNGRSARESRILSNLWLMSAATFRRLGKIEQAKGAIQEAEVRDENNPAVWVQLALYYHALGHHQHAIATLQKALFIDPDDVSATVHLSRLYLTPLSSHPSSSSFQNKDVEKQPSANDLDLATGLLAHITKGQGWDVPEAWYFLGKSYGMQGRKEREMEALTLALRLAEGRGVREIGAAIGLCI